MLLFGGLFGGMALLAWVLGDSMRYRRGYYAALEDRAARLEAERDAQAKIAAATASPWSDAVAAAAATTVARPASGTMITWRSRRRARGLSRCARMK